MCCTPALRPSASSTRFHRSSRRRWWRLPKLRPLAPTEHTDRTDWPFITLDPATSTDLDQAFTIERSGDDLLLHYAIADVAWFVQPGDALDHEAWKRGATLYLPDGKAGLYPPALAEGAASLLPDGPRPAVVFHVRVAGDGAARLDGAERAVIRSRAKLAYDSVTAADLPADFDEFARRVQAAAVARGAGTIEPPEQQVEHVGGDGYQLVFRPRLPSEDHNAAMSLAANLAVADAMFRAGTGLFRVMPEPDERAVKRLRHTARGFGLAWPADQSLGAFSCTLDANDPKHAVLMLAERRAGGGADYQPFTAGVTPWHAAMAATYAHSTARCAGWRIATWCRWPWPWPTVVRCPTTWQSRSSCCPPPWIARIPLVTASSGRCSTWRRP